MDDTPNTLSDREIRRARRRRLTERLEALRERINLIESELQQYTKDFFRVCIFGSARTKPDDEIYKTTERLAYLLAQEGIDILTGGGPGLMKAANKGAKEGQLSTGSRSKSFGLSINLAAEMGQNEHLDIKHHHRKFSSRLDDFMRLSNAVVVTPGGIGTLLELYFSWQLLQVGHLPERPIILMNESFWRGLIDWMKENQVGRGLVSPGDVRWIHFAETPEQALAIIKVEFEKFKDTLAAKGIK